MAKSAYVEIYEKIKGKIVSGDYKYPEKLPSKRSMAIDENVSVITIQNAYALLVDEGYVEAREKSGYYVIYRQGDFLIKEKAMQKSYDTAILKKVETSHTKGNFSFNILAKTTRKVIADYGEKIMEKAPNEGCPELRVAIRDYLASSRGMHVGVEQIIIGSGAEYLYSLVAQLFKEASSIAVEKPCYDKIAKVYRSFGHSIDELEMGKNGIKSESLAECRAEVLHVTPFHSFPSNITADISKKGEYLHWASGNRYIVEDNYDSELTVSSRLEDPLFTLDKGGKVIYINTFSKTIAPSIRVGYMILPRNLLEKFKEKLGFYSCTVPVLEQYIICELLKSGDYQRHLNRVRRSLRKKQEL